MRFKLWIEMRDINKKEIEEIGDYRIFLVNASAIRDKSTNDDNFNHLAVHEDYPSLIPKNEIWISKDISKHERQFLIHNGVNRYEALRKGIKDTYTYALKRERAEREKVDGIKFDPKAPPPEKLYVKVYCEIPSDNIKVWLIDGEIARDLYKTDFIEGGNCEVYKWVPEGEIWIEKNLRERQEIPITILHEYVESTLMREKKFKYGKAHNIAVKVDWRRRQNFSKADVKALTTEKALEWAKPYLNNTTGD